ncbi:MULTISPECIES: HAMP domain-containing sensor histidine kinase [Paenibacillus]|uniref:sensor histidine kinase n=1 Tax=Paenibacillus TaxID=44249 RepID=UPI0014704172|nr:MULTISPECIES: HAMP domain-containing sensor histidine kinase [Paenibacillus]MDF9846160.1 two-component system sensor histidine kinase BaeS [Paenibacillus sp. PastM-2]MDH6477538.1 two-component system sensor histidine kinase BaeS [Paenibacillus sp. PastH-2]
MEWGIGSMDMNKLFFWKRHLSWKLMFVNGIVVLIVIWLAGFSLKDFACVTVGQFETVGLETTRSFNQVMQFYLWRASFLAIVVGGLVHFFFVRKLLTPLNILTHSIQSVMKGEQTEPITQQGEDELGRLIHHFNHMSAVLHREEQHRKRWMSNISHELRTPISNLNGYLEALTEGVIVGDPVLYRSLYEESQHLSRLVDQLHSLSVWEAKQLTEQEKMNIQIEKLCNQVVQSFCLDASKKGIHFHNDIEPYEIRINPQGIKQVITNLVANAVLYDIGKEIWIQGSVANGIYKFSIANYGRPISEEAQPFLFERFVKGDPFRPRKGDITGTGLGLAIVKEIVEQHNGEVGLQSDNSKYTFWFTLPIS